MSKPHSFQTGWSAGGPGVRRGHDGGRGAPVSASRRHCKPGHQKVHLDALNKAAGPADSDCDHGSGHPLQAWGRDDEISPRNLHVSRLLCEALSDVVQSELFIKCQAFF